MFGKFSVMTSCFAFEDFFASESYRCWIVLISEEDSFIEFTYLIRGVKEIRLVFPSPFTPYPFGKGSFVALSNHLFKKTKRRKKSPPTKNADRQKGIEKLINMIRQFILMGVIFPGDGRAFFDMSMTVEFCRYGMCFMAATSF